MLLIIAMAFPFVLEDSNAQGDIPAKETTVNRDSKPIMGTLATVGNKPIVINGASTPSGATVMSGALLQTYAGIGAAVMLCEAGRLDIAPGSLLRLTYNASSVEVELKKGCAILTTNAGFAGSVLTPQGTIERTGPDRRASVDVCSGEQGASAPLVNVGAAADARAGICWAMPPVPLQAAGFNWFWVAAGASPLAVLGAVALNRNNRPDAVSQSAP